eukprot:3123976-Prymnesium_polylepis.3
MSLWLRLSERYCSSPVRLPLSGCRSWMRGSCRSASVAASGSRAASRTCGRHCVSSAWADELSAARNAPVTCFRLVAWSTGWSAAR